MAKNNLRQAIAAGTQTSLDATQEALDRIEASKLGAWLAMDSDVALAAAASIDARRAAGETLHPLAGVPMGVKDMIATRGLLTTAASRVLRDFVPPYDATLIRRLRAAGAIILGKLNQDEFGFGSSNESSAMGPCLNPHDPSRVPGGSSGGSAAAVAAGHCPVTLGTDTGGSIRQPASFCGVFGIKPTYGRVSRYGVVAFASSLDQVGPLSERVEDAALTLQTMAGHDVKDSTSLPDPVPDYGASLHRGVEGLRIGIPAEYFGEGLEPCVERHVRRALATLEAAGAVLIPLSLPHTSYAVATYYVLATAEASSNLARYDGVRYGHRTAQPVDSLDELIAKSRSEGFGAEAKRRIMLGTYVLSTGYYDAYYLKAQKVRTLITRDFEAAFQQCDLLAAPTSPLTAFRLGEKIDDPLTMYLTDILTIPASLAGLPAASQMCGMDAQGLPVGIQWIAPRLQEEVIFQAAGCFEAAFEGGA